MAEKGKKTENPNATRISIDGVDLDIDNKVRGSWKFVSSIRSLIRAEDENDQDGMLINAYDCISLLLGDQIEKVIEHYGGDPSFADMRDFYQKAIDALNAKNS